MNKGSYSKDKRKNKLGSVYGQIFKQQMSYQTVAATVSKENVNECRVK